MTQTQPPTPSNPPPSTAPKTSPQDDDPLSHLYKMSITAGLGSGEYIAVNGAAVLSVLLGLASALTLLEPLLLIIPLIGIFVGIIALRQISRSNGTQTGRGLVVLGLVLMLGFGGLVFGQKVLEDIRTREDRQAIQETVHQIGELSKAGKYDAAYDLFSSRFHDRVKPQEFQEKIKFLGNSAVYGKLKSAEAGLMEFSTDESNGAQYAVARIQLEFEKIDKPLPDDLTFKKEGDKWKVEAFKSLFPPAAAPPGR